MDPRFWSVVERAAAMSPRVGRKMVGAFLRVASPFNAPLRAQIEAWEPTACRVRVPNRRPLHNHLGGIHACAIATAGESAAGLLLLRTFPFSRYRLIMKDLSIVFERQARCSELVAEATQTDASIAAVRDGLDGGSPQLVPMETRITEASGERLATVQTTWQVKPWEQVRVRA